MAHPGPPKAADLVLKLSALVSKDPKTFKTQLPSLEEVKKIYTWDYGKIEHTLKNFIIPLLSGTLQKNLHDDNIAQVLQLLADVQNFFFVYLCFYRF